MLGGEARRAASILHHRTMQCQSGPKAWFHDRCNRVDSDACRRGNVGTRVGDTIRARARSTARDARRAAWKGWRVRGAPPGRVRVAPPEPHRSWNRSERDQRGCGQRWRELGREQGTARRHAGSTARKPASSTIWTSLECIAEAGPSYRSCTTSAQRRRGVTVPSLIETICELQMTPVRACVNKSDTDPAALLRAQNRCVYVTSHLIHSQQRCPKIGRIKTLLCFFLQNQPCVIMCTFPL